MDKIALVTRFRERLSESLSALGLSQSAFCRVAGIDRSTLNQLLTSDEPRLPRADTIAAIAGTLQVSADWLLGLSQQAERGAEILEQSVQIAPTPHSPVDELIQEWLEESRGFKIRYVPYNLPDMLCIDEVLSYTYDKFPQRSPAQAQTAMRKQLDYSRMPDTDFEICSPIDRLETLALGQGMWKGLDREARIQQIEAMAAITDELYPSFRWYLYDGISVHSAPITIFGPNRAAVYVGGMYFVYNTTEHIRILTRHFDDLIRQASIQAFEISEYLEGLLRKI